MPQPELLATLARYDIEYTDLRRKQNWKNSGRGEFTIEVLTMRSFVRYAIDVERVLGTKYFLAVASQQQAQLALDAYLWAKQKYGGST